MRTKGGFGVCFIHREWRQIWPLKTEAKLGVWTGGLGQKAGPLTTLHETVV